MAKTEIISLLNPRLAVRKRIGGIAYVVFILAILFGMAGLAVLLVQVLIQGIPWLSWHFVSDYPSRFPEQAGMKSALFGTIWVMGLTGLFTVPVGVGAAIYLEEYAAKNWLTRVIEVNISNLAGVPSIVYGLLGLAVFRSGVGAGPYGARGSADDVPARDAYRHHRLAGGDTRRPADVP